MAHPHNNCPRCKVLSDEDALEILIRQLRINAQDTLANLNRNKIKLVKFED